MTKKLTAVSYLGGKAAWGKSGVGRFVARHLPYDNQYCEPFAGMLGVLLARKPSRFEYVNDLNENIVDWWRVVRDHQDELAAKLEATPHSFTEFWRCRELMLGGMSHLPLVERARVVTVALQQSVNQILGAGSWSIQVDNPRGGCMSDRRNNLVRKLPRLAERMKDVVLYNHHANHVISKCCRAPGMVLYLDPPYAVGGAYYQAKITDDERATMVELITSNECEARVAISGHDGEYPELEKAGWRKETMTYLFQALAGDANNTGLRTEALWMNYEPPGQQSLSL